jgi:hypothetical protein
MSKDKRLLGRLKTDAGTCADGSFLYLTKHSWDCGWYWGFGYVGNANCHFHFDSLLYIKDSKGTVKYEASDLFAETKITDKEWWVIRDLFVQAYALKKAAKVYRHGGHQTQVPGVTDIIKHPTMVVCINKDLEKVLDTLWSFIVVALDKPEAVTV